MSQPTARANSLSRMAVARSACHLAGCKSRSDKKHQLTALASVTSCSGVRYRRLMLNAVATVLQSMTALSPNFKARRSLASLWFVSFKFAATPNVPLRNVTK